MFRKPCLALGVALFPFKQVYVIDDKFFNYDPTKTAMTLNIKPPEALHFSPLGQPCDVFAIQANI